MKKKEIKNRNGNQKKFLKPVWMVLCVCCLLEITSFKTYAKETEQEAEAGVTALNQIMTAAEDVEAKETPSHSAKVTVTYEKDATVFVTGETANGWYQVSYQKVTGYIPKEKLANQPHDEALDQEFQAMEEESAMIVEEVERYRAESRRSKIWGAVIILLIMGIFATGIISTGKNDKDEEKDGDEKENLKVQKDINVIDLDHDA